MADGYISQIKTPDNKVYDFRDQHLKVYTGSCTTAAGTAIKDVTTDGEFTLAKGAVIFVNFSTTNTAAVANLKLRVNSSTDTDAKPIKHQYNASESNLPGVGYIRANQTYAFYYDGTNWIMITDYNTNDNDTSRTYERYNHTRLTCTTTFPRYSLAFTHATDSTKVIPVNSTENNVTDTKSTITTEPFNIFEKIYYKSDAPSTVLAANSLVAVGVLWYAYSALDLRYSFNLTTTSLTAHKDVYLVCSLVTPTTATLRGASVTGANASTLSNNQGPITQTLPSSEDNLIYIKLGRSYSAYQITLTADHPIYWYKNGEIQPYAGYATATSRAAITSTANAVAYYTNTTGTFGSKASANGALYATSANGALQWGTLPIAQGGTGVVSFTKNQVILSDNTNGTTGLTSRAYSDSTSAEALSSTSTNFVTERDVYFGLPTLNNAHNYTSSSTYYAPTTGGTAGHILIGAGATTAPAWYGGTVMSGSAAASWKTAFNGTTDATATNAAAVTIAGGLGISKKLYVGDTATVPDLTIGSTNEYGDAYTPIYWHEGVPTVVTLTQQCAFTIKSGKSGVRLSHAAITANSYITQIVVTSGEANLNSAISWTSAAGYIELTCSSTVSGDVTGYIMISRGDEITATATDIA